MTLKQLACDVGFWPKKYWREALDEIAELGFQGVENLEILRLQYCQKVELGKKILTDRNLSLAGLSYTADFANPDLEQIVQRECTTRFDFLQQMGARWLVVHPGSRETFISEREDFKRIAHLLSELGKNSAEMDIGLCVRNGLGERIEKEADIDRLFNLVETDVVSLCAEPGHLFRAGENPVEVLRVYDSVIRHLHLQDAVRDEEHPDGGYFCELGQGEMDVSSIQKALMNIKETAWITGVLEASAKDPSESANRIYSFLYKTFHSADEHIKD